MRVVVGGKLEKIDGQILREPFARQVPESEQGQRPDRNVRVSRINGQRIYFRDLARMAWPEKTESHLAHHARVDTRTARRWLADDNGPPADALGIVLAEIMRRYGQRD